MTEAHAEENYIDRCYERSSDLDWLEFDSINQTSESSQSTPLQAEVSSSPLPWTNFGDSERDPTNPAPATNGVTVPEGMVMVWRPDFNNKEAKS